MMFLHKKTDIKSHIIIKTHQSYSVDATIERLLLLSDLITGIIMKHSYHLDSLRGLLSLVVVFQHAATAFIYSKEGLASPVNTFLGFSAHYAVIFFFVLSGYVISISIHENIKRNEGFSASEYSLARSIRIIPPLLGAIVLSLLLMTILIHYDAQSVGNGFKFYIRKLYSPDAYQQILSLATLTLYGGLDGGPDNANGALWSLVYEIQFYVLAGLISATLFAKNNHIKIISIFLLILYWNALGVKNTANIQWVSFISFAIGSLTFLLRDTIVKSWYFIPLVTAMIICLVGLKTAWAGPYTFILELKEHPPHDSDWVMFRILFAVLFALLIVHIDKFGKAISWFHALAPFSYSLYIIHFPIVVFAWFLIVNHKPEWLSNMYTLTLFAVFASVISSWIFGKIFEKPKQQRLYLHRLIAKLNAY